MKVALLFGQLRNVTILILLINIRKWIFDEYDVDTCHVWWDVSEYDVSDWVGEQCIVSS